MLQSGDLENYLDYFECWADNDPDVKFYLYGGVEFGIAHATGNSSFGYPFVWLEQPTIETEDNEAGQYIERYFTAICFITKAKQDDLEAQKLATIDMYRLACRLQKKLLKDNKTGNFIDLSVKMRKNEVDKGWAKNHCGWKLEFEICLNGNPNLV